MSNPDPAYVASRVNQLSKENSFDTSRVQSLIYLAAAANEVAAMISDAPVTIDEELSRISDDITRIVSRLHFVMSLSDRLEEDNAN